MAKGVFDETKDLGREKILLDYHNALYRLTGMPMDFASADGDCFKLCPENHINPLCKLIRACPEGLRRCQMNDDFHTAGARLGKKAVIYLCHAGLTDITVPIFFGKKFAGCVTAGQVLDRKPSEKSFREFLSKISDLDSGADEAELRDHFFKTPFFSAEKLRAAADLISLVVNYIAESRGKLMFFEKILESDKVSVTRRFAGENYKRKISVEDAAARVYLSPGRFSHLFKQETGTSFIQYLNRLRVDKAKELLINTKMSVTEISSETGFSSLTHFNRIFKKTEGVSPAAFKKSRKGK
jgi:AraC-like DNA-binding protein/ligand-binding sensor protein